MWRPTSPRPNPLLALRRVVELPGAPSGVAALHRSEHTGTVRVASTAATALAVLPDAELEARNITPPPPAQADRRAGAMGPAALRPERRATHTASAAASWEAGRPGRSGGRGRPWAGSASGRRRPGLIITRTPASQPEPSRREPNRPPMTLITSTPPFSPWPALGRPITGLFAVASPAPVTSDPGPAEPPGHQSLVAPIRPLPDLAPGSDAPGGPQAPTPSAAAVGAGAARPEHQPLERGGAARLGRQRPVRAGATRLGRRPMTARQSLATMLVCLGLWGLVDAPALARSAASSQLGNRRTIALDVLRPVSRLSAALGVDRIGHLGDILRGRRAPSPRRLPPSDRRGAPTPPGRPIGAPVTPTTPVLTIAPLRVPTAADPLRVVIIGDSLGLSFGQSLAAKLEATGVVRATVDAREGTGLVRSDAFDWPGQTQADLVRFRPEVVVASFGGNDAQDIVVDGRYVAFGTPRWQQLYRSRVLQVLDEVHAARAHLLWSGLPIMSDPSRTAGLRTVMGVTQAAVAGHEAALWVDNLATLADAAGHYQVAMTDGSGQQVLVREPDGIHETRAGADRLADHAIAAMVAGWQLDLHSTAGPRSVS